MKKNYDDKQIKGGGEELVCIGECEAPGVGAWKIGDKISDPALIDKFRDNPNFKVITREDK